MPTVLCLDGLRVAIYPNDPNPARVHVIGGACEAVFELHCPDGPPEICESSGFSPPELAQVQAALAASLGNACNEWSKIHGNS
jgi:hypothetical protein